MSRYQKLMFTTIVAVGLGFSGFAFLILGHPDEASVSSGVLAMAILGYLSFVFLVLAVQQKVARADTSQFPDEREADLDVRSEQIGYRILEGGVFVLIVLILLGARSDFSSWGRFDLMQPAGMIFALMCLITLAGLARLISALIMDRRF